MGPSLLMAIDDRRGPAAVDGFPLVLLGQFYGRDLVSVGGTRAIARATLADPEEHGVLAYTVTAVDTVVRVLPYMPVFDGGRQAASASSGAPGAVTVMPYKRVPARKSGAASEEALADVIDGYKVGSGALRVDRTGLIVFADSARGLLPLPAPPPPPPASGGAGNVKV